MFILKAQKQLLWGIILQKLVERIKQLIFDLLKPFACLSLFLPNLLLYLLELSLILFIINSID